MTLREMKEMLDELERMYGDKVLDMEVYAEYPYGDRTGTRALIQFSTVVTEVPRKTAYSDSGYSRPKLNPYYDDEESEEEKEVIVLARW